MGLTPDLVVGTWVGGEDRWVRFLSIADGAGAKMARPFFAKFIRKLEEDKNADYDINARFYRPKGDLGIEINCSIYAGDENPFDPEDEDESFGDEKSEDEKFGDESEEEFDG